MRLIKKLAYKSKGTYCIKCWFKWCKNAILRDESMPKAEHVRRPDAHHPILQQLPCAAMPCIWQNLNSRLYVDNVCSVYVCCRIETIHRVHLNCASYGYFHNTTDRVGAIFWPTCSELRNYWSNLKKNPTAFDRPGKLVEVNQTLLTSGSLMTSEVRSKLKCLNIWHIWFCRALQPYQLEISQCNNMDHESIQRFTGLVMAQNMQQAKGREKCGNNYAAEFFTSIVCGYHGCR